MVAPSSASSSLKEYLKRYENNDENDKKKKKKKKAKPNNLGVVVVDEDPIWQKPVKSEEENDDSADEEKPQVDEDIEVKRMKRMEQLRARRPFGAISEDGSGWVSISDDPVTTNEQNSDISPPRKRRARNDTPSPEQGLDPSGTMDTDLSPPRQRHRARYDTPSPELDLKPSESGKKVTDLSPPRKRRIHNHSPSIDPEAKPVHFSSPDPDLSPPRRSRSQKLMEKERKNYEILDVRGNSPPEADLSPPRRKKKDIAGTHDVSPQTSGRHSRDFDASRVSSVSDLSPPRKVRKESTSFADRPKTGLVTGRDAQQEIEKTRREESMKFKQMDAYMSGRGAEPVYRDKITGQRLSKDQLLQLQKKEEKPKEIKLEWGKGLAQKREAEEKQQELELEKAKPFARTRDDPELDRLYKDRIRFGDPMAHLVKTKHSDMLLPNLGDDEKMKESGFIVPQDIPSHSWIKRGLDAAPNRYGIKPGRHWDGVDRSNGFEKQLFRRANEKQASEREAYLWSVSDM